ncbi:Gldg family protein [Halomonadaceae bacterium KBTZ08]
MRETFQVCRKEFRSFFASPAAYLLLGVFLVAVHFTFFWGEAFFARNTADLGPLFEWFPLLLIFLVAALTMRSWSEERRSGTLQTLLTVPVSPGSLIAGKLLAGLALLSVGIVLTLPLPITVSLLGPLDWGPVIGGYVATFFLGLAYLAIGLCMSSLTSNAVVSLILTTATCGVLYVIGAPVITSLFGYGIGDWLEQFGTGSRFDDITRGVLDVRDLCYYLTVAGIFLALNRLSLERLRWAGNPRNRNHRVWGAVAALAVANLVLVNVWLAPVNSLRADLTEGNRYTLSATTLESVQTLREPVTIRAYFSSKTHPMLAPLVPRLRDLLNEYAVMTDQKVRVRFVDPTKDKEAEKRAANRYGVEPVPFQTSSRYESSVVNAYFNVVVEYGDQHETLGFRDLIRVQRGNGTEMDVALKDPEYEITRSIRKLAGQYAGGGNLLARLDGNVELTAYASPKDQLPKPLAELRGKLGKLFTTLGDESSGGLATEVVAPDQKTEQRLTDQLNLKPLVAGINDPNPFWFHLLLERGEQRVEVTLPEELSKAALRRNIEASLKRITPGALDTVTLVTPEAQARGRRRMAAQGPRFSRLNEALSESMRVETSQLKQGRVPPQTDLLMVMAPDKLNDKQLFAVDQFLMRGGRVVMAASPYQVSVGRSLRASKHDSGVSQWLQHHGLTVRERLVADARNATVPLPVTRTVSGRRLREIRMQPYPFAPDLRGDQLNPESPITAPMNQLTMPWASPIKVDTKANSERTVTRLATSSGQSWLQKKASVLPDFQAHPETGFDRSESVGSQPMAVSVKGRFKSFFADKPSPLLADQEEESDAEASGKGKKSKEKGNGDEAPQYTRVIEQSPASASLVLVASNAFGSDATLQLLSQTTGSLYSKPLTFLRNAADWSLEDPALLALRGRSHEARTLAPLDAQAKRYWEYGNYALSGLGLVLIWVWRVLARRRDAAFYRTIKAEV